MPERYQNVTDSSPCQCQSSRSVSWRLAGNCMRNTNKSTISYSAMPREVEKYTRCPYTGRDHRQKLTGSSNWYVVGPIIARSFNKNQLITFAEILLRDRQTDRQTDRQNECQTTNQPDYITSALTKVKITASGSRPSLKSSRLFLIQGLPLHKTLRKFVHNVSTNLAYQQP